MSHPLDAFQIAATNDPEQAQSILSRELTELRLARVRDRRFFRLEMNGVYLGKTMVGYNVFDTDTWVDAGEIDHAILMVVGVGPPSVFHVDGERIVCTERAAVVSPSRRIVIERPAGGGIFLIRADLDAIRERFREVMDRRPAESFVFETSVELASGVGAQTRRFLNHLVDDVQRDKAILENPLLRAGFDDMVLNTLLALPNTHTNDLMGEHQITGAPRLVRQAEEFLEAHATEPITISDVVTELVCSRRVLFATFRKYRGYSPMQFLADRRMVTARRMLRSPCPMDTVSTIAYACGFSHQGRFADAYRRRFGESPSETLRFAAPPIGR